MCKSEENIEKVDLKNDKFEDITISINEKKKENIRFDTNRWRVALGDKFDSRREEEENEENEEDEEDEYENEDQGEINKLNDDIKNKEAKINDLREKIRDIKDKIDIMQKILNIDVSEQDYLKELSQKAKAN